jgi:hypothetical protein
MEEGARSGIPVLFCHVPEEGYPFSLGEMSEVIKNLVSCMIEMHEGSEESYHGGLKVSRMGDSGQ